MQQKLRDYFIPHKENDYTPHVLQRVAMLLMLGLILLTFTTANLQSLLWFTSDWLVSTILPGVIVDLTNDEREDLAVAPLARNVTLDEAARLKAEHMAQNQYFAHHSPDGVSPWYWFSQVGYNYLHAGENLAIHFSDSGEVVDAWMDSPSHRANIANGSYQEIGVGTARGNYQGFDTVYVVQLFGTQAAAAPSESAVTVDSSTGFDTETQVLAEQTEVVEVEVPAQAETVSESNVAEIPPFLAQAEPEASEVPQAIDVNEEPEAPAADTTPEEAIEIEDVTVNEDSVSIYSGTIATSVPGVPATIGTQQPTPPRESSFLGEVVTQPSFLLQISYVLIGLFVIAVLMLSILIEIRQQRPLQIAYGFGLLALMTGLFYLHSIVIEGAVIV